jgi:hypothetical protein
MRTVLSPRSRHWTRARYGTTTCNADRLNADAADQALFANLAAFYRTERHLIAAAASRPTRPATRPRIATAPN